MLGEKRCLEPHVGLCSIYHTRTPSAELLNGAALATMLKFHSRSVLKDSNFVTNLIAASAYWYFAKSDYIFDWSWYEVKLLFYSSLESETNMIQFKFELAGEHLLFSVHQGHPCRACPAHNIHETCSQKLFSATMWICLRHNGALNWMLMPPSQHVDV